MNILRRLPLSRLVLGCALILVVGISATALALAVGAGPTPPPKPLAQAVHDALTTPPVEGVSARIQLTDHLLEGANLASEGGQAGQLGSSPLLSGAAGRLWISKDGRVRLELQSEKGDTQILYDGHAITLYDAASNTSYRYTPPAGEQANSRKMRPDAGAGSDVGHEAPSVVEIEEAIAKLSKHASLSGATPTDVAGHAAYTVRVSPNEGGSLLGGVELSWDAVHGVPLRAAIYSTNSSAAVIELAATEISYGPVEASVFEFTPPPGTKVREVKAGEGTAGARSARVGRTARRTGRRLGQIARRTESGGGRAGRPKVITEGHGPGQIAVVETKAKQGGEAGSSDLPEGLPKVEINGASATELSTALGTLLTFERSGVRYVLLGSVTPGAIETVARGL